MADKKDDTDETEAERKKRLRRRRRKIGLLLAGYALAQEQEPPA